MIRVLFICHGNICRSPMAEFIFRDMVDKRGLGAQFFVASAATSREEIGNPVYPPAKRKLKEHGIDPAGKTARQMTAGDYRDFDYLLAAERYNIRNMERITGGDPEQNLQAAGFFGSPPGHRGSLVHGGLRRSLGRYRGRLPGLSGMAEKGGKDLKIGR